ncbi:MAG: sulfurtransferase complex subunit TusD [Pseudomonadota bacterium]
MRLSLYITAAPEQESAFRAWQFAQAAVAAGHQLERIFFAGAGVQHGQSLAAPGRDEVSLTQRWQQLQQQVQALPDASELSCELVLCVSAALRHGVLDAENAQRWEKPAVSLAPGFVISGLGQLAEAQLAADRLIQFPA